MVGKVLTMEVSRPDLGSPEPMYNWIRQPMSVNSVLHGKMRGREESPQKLTGQPDICSGEKETVP